MTMMIKQGTVLENNKGKLLISVTRNEACGSCQAKGTCGQKEETIIEVYSTDDTDITKYSIYVYLLPVFMMIVGALLPNIFLKNTGYDINLLTLISVVIFFAISFMIIKGIDKNLSNNNVMKVRKI